MRTKHTPMGIPRVECNSWPLPLIQPVYLLFKKANQMQAGVAFLQDNLDISLI